jgi:hypothetical protein
MFCLALALASIAGLSGPAVCPQTPDWREGPALAQTTEAAPVQAGAEQALAFHPISTLDGKGKPLAGIEVLYLVEAELSQARMGRLGLAGSDSLTQLAFFGQRLVSDEQGVAQIPAWSEGVCVVLVRREALADMRNLRQAEAIGTEVRLRDRGSLLIDLKDAAGAAQRGGAVCVREVLGGEMLLVRAAPCDGVLGRGQLDMLDVLKFQLAEGSALVLEPFGHFEAPERRPLDLESIPTEPVALTCPDFGSLAIQLARSNGDKPCGRVEVLVRVVGENASAPISYLTVDGELNVPRVGVGTELELVVRRPGGKDRDPVQVKGPSKAGEAVAINVPFEDAELVLIGRLTDAGGSALYRRTFQGVAKARNVFFRREFDFQFVSEPDGGFQLLLPLDEKIPLSEASVLIEQLGLENQPIGRFEWKLDRELSADCIDLGAVKLTSI